MMLFLCHRTKKLALFVIVVAVIVGCVAEPSAVNTKDPKHSTMPSGESSASSENNTGEASVSSSNSELQSIEDRQIVSDPSDTSSGKHSADDDSDLYVNGKKLSIPKITGSVPPRDDSYHDTDNNAIVVLQSPTEAMASFPRDRRKEVDWVKTLDRGFIDPRADLKGESHMKTMDLDILMKNTQFMPWVKFPHLAHTKWLDCSNCHPAIFIPQENANPISMNKVLRGEYCGVCHDKVSFSLFICERCHSVPHEGSGPAWWKTDEN